MPLDSTLADLPGSVLAAFAAAFGLLVGSFLNVCIYRLPRDLSVVRPRSRCPQCERPIRSWDNVPVLSYLLLGRKCRDCGLPISFRYPLVEMLTAVLFAWFVFRFGFTVLAWRDCVFSALFLALIFTDLETRLLPEPLTVGGIGAGLVFALLTPVGDGTAHSLTGLNGRTGSLADAFLGAIFPACGLWLTGWIFEKITRRAGLGFGDVVMISEAGAFLGPRAACLTLLVASIAGSVIGVSFILIRRKDHRTYELPLGSFLGAAGIAVAAFGAAFIQWYGGFFE